jgi:hypothetical protein
VLYRRARIGRGHVGQAGFRVAPVDSSDAKPGYRITVGCAQGLVLVAVFHAWAALLISAHNGELVHAWSANRGIGGTLLHMNPKQANQYEQLAAGFRCSVRAPPAGFEPALTAPEGNSI